MVALRAPSKVESGIFFRDALLQKPNVDYRTRLNSRSSSETVLQRDVRVAKEIGQPVLDVLRVPKFKIRVTFSELLQVQACLNYLFELEIAARSVHRINPDLSHDRLFDRISHEVQISRSIIDQIFETIDDEGLQAIKRLCLRFGIRVGDFQANAPIRKNETVQLKFF